MTEFRSVFALDFRVGAGSGEKGRSERGMRGTYSHPYSGYILIPWPRFHTSIAGCVGSIPGWGWQLKSHLQPKDKGREVWGNF